MGRLRNTMLCLSAAIAIIQFASGQDPQGSKLRQLEAQDQLITKVKADSSLGGRPRPEGGMSSVINIVDMNVVGAVWEGTEALLDITLRQTWKDSRLTYRDSPNEYSYVTLPNDVNIWTPDTYFVNGRQKSHSDLERFLRVEPSGDVKLSQRNKCPKVGRFFVLVPPSFLGNGANTYADIAYHWVPGSNAVKFTPEANAFEAFAPYTLVDASTSQCTDQSFSTGVFGCLQVDLFFKGATYEPCLYFYLPSMILLFVSWLHFFIHGSWTVPRTLSAVAPFLIFAAALLFLDHPHTVGITAYDVWLIFCLLMTFFSLLEYFVCICCGVRRAAPPSDQEKPLLDNEEAKKACTGKGGATALDYLSRVLFPFVFIVFIILYVLLYLLL